MRVYELIFILKPDLPEEEIEAAVEQFKGVITAGGGAIDKVEKWGKRRLAYEVKHYSDGYYVLVQYSLTGDAALAKEVERRLRVSDAVIKYMTVRIDQELKRLEKLKARREKRVAKKPAPASAPGEAKPPSRPEGSAPGVPEEAEKESA